MEILIVRHGEVAAHDPDVLTSQGMRQAAITAGWLNYNFCLAGYVGLSSPYFCTAQTASALQVVTKMDFGVEEALRNFTPSGQPKTTIINKSLLFQNMRWPLWDADEAVYLPEDITECLDRCQSLVYSLNERGYDKYLLVTHAVPCVVLSELLSGKSPESIRQRCGAMDSQKIGSVSETMDRHLFLNGYRYCGLTLIRDGKPEWFSRTVYDME